MATKEAVEDVLRETCVRCAVALDHPHGHYPRTCLNCGRVRDV